MEKNKKSTKRIFSKLQDGPRHMEIHDGLSEDSDSPLLNTLVRKTYFKYIKAMLSENAARLNISDRDVIKYAQEIELNALKTCMSSMVYRYVMLSEIGHIKYLTSSKVSFTEKKLLDPDEVTESTDGLSLFLQHYASHTTKNCPPSLFESIYLKTKPVALNTEPPTVVQNIADEISIKSEPGAPENNIHPTPVPPPVVQEQKIRPIREIKIEKMEDNNDLIAILTGSESSSDCIIADSSQDCSNKQEGSEDMFTKVYKEMSEMFAAEEASCSTSKPPELNNIPPSPTSIISTDRYFAYCDPNFWFLEFEINRARFQQISATMHELNEKKYDTVARRIRDIFGTDDSPVMAESPVAFNKVTQVCKERITWHVKKGLSLFYKKKRFRSADEFRILAKNIVTSLIQIDPFMGYRNIYKAINKAFDKKDVYVQNITQIQNIVSRVCKYVFYFTKAS